MKEEKSALNRQTFRRLAGSVGMFLKSPSGKKARWLLAGLNLTWPAGLRVLVHGSNRAGRIALFRAAAGILENGTGSILRPPYDQVAFLPERPFLPPCSLRDLLVPHHDATGITESQIQGILTELGLATIVSGRNATDEPLNWRELLSFGEAKLLGVAQAVLARPRFVFIDELGSSLDEADRQLVLDLMTRHHITCIIFGSEGPPPSWQGAALELHDDGSWTWQDARPSPTDHPLP